MPPASPAAIMFVKSGSKVFGCFRMASASEAPPSTSARVCRMTAAKFALSSCVPRISRHCTSGRPASIITENWRVKTARFFAGAAFARAFFGAGAALACDGVIRVTRTCSRLSAETTASIVSPTRSPLMISPARVRPEKAKVGMGLPCHRPRLHPRPSKSRARHDADAAVDHFLQFVAQRGRAHRGLERDRLLEVQRRQRLVHRLHARLLLARLHRRVDLVDLVFADQVSNA